MKDTEGLDLSWGNHKAMLEAIKRIALKEGSFGKLLALGSRKAAQKGGKEAEYYSITIKCQQMGMVDPRSMWAYGLGFGTSTRGGDHLRTMPAGEYMFTPEEMEKIIGTRKASGRTGSDGKGKLAVWYQNFRAAVNDSFASCKFFFRSSMRLYVEFPHRMLSALTGLGRSANPKVW